MDLFYNIYNSMPEILRRIFYTVYFVLVGPFVYLFGRLKAVFMLITNKSVRDFARVYLKVNIWLFSLFVFLGLSFYMDGLHQKSMIPTLISNLRIEVILITLFASVSIYYSRKYFNTPYKKGVKNGSYTKKKWNQWCWFADY